MRPLIDILLTTFNGEKYISEQIDSIFNQEFRSWRLLIRDDGSSDNTVSIINKYKSTHPDKITIINDFFGNLGTAQSFSHLLQEIKAPYVAFCDQDDVWLPNKLQKQMELMQRVESRLGKHCPILVNSDLCVANKELSLLSSSFWKYQMLDPVRMESFEKLLLQNYVTGCTCLLNRKLVELSMPIPSKAITHDWWIALVAIAKGKIINMPDVTVIYRQHDRNDTGAKKWGMRHILITIVNGPRQWRANLMKTRDQARELINTGLLDDNESVVVRNYVDMFDKTWFWRRVSMIRGGFMKYGVTRNIAMFLLL